MLQAGTLSQLDLSEGIGNMCAAAVLCRSDILLNDLGCCARAQHAQHARRSHCALACGPHVQSIQASADNALWLGKV